MKYNNNHHKLVRNLSRSGTVYGSCVSYPTHEACSKLGEVSCNITTEEECNNLKINLDKIHSGFEVYFDRNRTCGNTKRTRPEILSGPNDVLVQPLYPLYARFNSDVKFMSRGGPCYDNEGNERYDENGQSVCFVNNEPLPNFERIEYSCEKGITTKGDRNSIKFFKDTTFTENESDYCLGCERNNNLYAESDKPYHFVLNGNKPMAYKAIGRKGYLSQTTLYPIGDKKTSGMICANSGCTYISDIKRYLSKNGTIQNTIYVYTPDVFNKLRYGSVKFNSIADAKKHFIEMYEIGGHGYNRPLSIDEMYEAHKDADALLTKNDLIQMLITYEIEKSVGLVDGVSDSYCACEVLSELDITSVNIDFPFSYSPIKGQDTLRVNVVRGTENYVVHNLNGMITVNATYSLSKRYSDKKKPLDSTFQKVNSRHEIVTGEAIGTCFLEDGSIIYTTDRQCVRLGGNNANNLDEFYSENQKVRLKNKTYAYETRKTPDNYSQTFDIDYNPNVFSNQFDSDPDKNYDACANANSTLETCLSCVERNHVNMCEESKGKHACWNKFVGNAQTRGNEKTPEYKSPYCGDVRFFCKDLAPYSVCSRGISGDAREYRYATENTNVNDINAQQLPPQFYEPGLPDGKYNYINACCPEACSDCLFKAIRAAESGDVNDPLAPGIYDAGRNYPDVSNYYFRGCNAVNKCDGEDCCDGDTPVPNQDKKKCWSCGPFQIKRKYFDEAAKKYKNQHPACRVLRTYDYEKELCKDCKGSVQEIIKCCKRKHDISQLVIRCYLRRYTRNGSCQSGNCSCKTINSDGNQFTCQDIVRMHNGGGGRTRTIPCAQNRNATKPYWDKIKKALCNLGDECRRCISFDYSDCNEIKSIRYNCLFDDDPSRRASNDSGGNVRGKKVLQDTNTVPSDVLLKGNVGPFSYQGTDTKSKVFGYYYPLYLTPDAARKANPNALNENYFHTHSFEELPNYTFYMPNNSNNHGVATNGGFTEFVDIRQRIPTFFSKNTPDSLYIPMTDDSATIEPIRLRTKFKDGSEST